MPEGIHALLFYAYDGSIYQYTKLITFDSKGNPIAHHNIQFQITSGKDKDLQTQMSSTINEDNTINCITYTKNTEQEEEKKEGKIYQVQEDGKIKEIGIFDVENESDE